MFIPLSRLLQLLYFADFARNTVGPRKNDFSKAELGMIIRDPDHIDFVFQNPKIPITRDRDKIVKNPKIGKTRDFQAALRTKF